MKKVCVGIYALAVALTVATPVQAQEEGSFMVHLRLVNMKVDNGNSPRLAAGKVEVEEKVFPELDFSYFFTPIWRQSRVDLSVVTRRKSGRQ